MLLLLTGCAGQEQATEPSRGIAQPLSGLAYQSAQIQVLQNDEFANPGLLWVDRGEQLWTEAPAGGGSSCQGCHGPSATMRGAAARYPAYDPSTGGLINLTQRIEQCRVLQQGDTPLPYESEPLLALSAMLTRASAGLPFAVRVDGPAQPLFEQGRSYFYQRRGQLNLACHHCHEVNAGKMLRGEQLSQGQSNGYPTYRLQWQTLGSLHRRLRFCNQAIRAEPFPHGAPQYVALELFLAWRAGTLPLESPAVRR